MTINLFCTKLCVFAEKNSSQRISSIRLSDSAAAIEKQYCSWKNIECSENDLLKKTTKKVLNWSFQNQMLSLLFQLFWSFAVIRRFIYR